MQSSLKLNSTTLGLIASSNYIGYLLGSFLPIFLKIKNKKRFIIIFSLLIVSTTFLMGLNENIVFFILLRFITGISSALVFILTISLIFNYLNLLKKSNLQLYHFSGIGFGILTGTIVILLTAYFGYSWKIQWMMVGFLGFLLMFSLNSLPSEENIEENNDFSSKKKLSIGFITIVLGYFFFGIGYIIFGTFISALAANAETTINFHYLSWILVGIFAIPSIFIWKKIQSYIYEDYCLFLTNFTVALGLFFILLEYNTFFYGLSCVLYGIGVPSAVALVLIEGKKRYSGDAQISVAILTTGFSLGQIIGPYLAGILIDSFENYFTAMLLSMICLLISGLLMINPERFRKES